jgi:hypothetical protein
MSLETELKANLTAFVVFVVCVIALVGGLIFSNYRLDKYRIENGYVECERIGSAGTIWKKGGCYNEVVR